MKDKLTFLIGADNGLTNASKIIQELEYYRIKGESVAPFQAMILAYPALYTAIKAVAAVITKRNNPVSGPFDIFIGGTPAGLTVSTFAGSTYGYFDATGTSAQLASPAGGSSRLKWECLFL